ncbi:hypothetical protein ACWKWC_02470 [Geodermatophilus nigrescens]
MSTSGGRVMPSAVAVAVEYVGGALWDRSPGSMSMDPVAPLTLGLSSDLAAALERWSDAWGPLSRAYIYDGVPVDEAAEAAHWSEGRRLARAVKQDLVHRGRAEITVYFDGREVELN